MGKKMTQEEIKKMVQELGIKPPAQITMGLRKREWTDRLYLFCHRRGVSPNDLIFNVLDKYMDEEIDIQEEIFEFEQQMREKISKQRKGGDTKKN